MREFYLAATVALAFVRPTLADTYGNTTPFERYSANSANSVSGVQVSIPVDSFKLSSFGIMYGHEDFGDPRNSNAIFGLYTSGDDGMPGSLVAVTQEIFLSHQQTYDNIAFTTNPVVDAGTYWMMSLFESTGEPRLGTQDPNSVWVHFYGLYSDGMPDEPGNTIYVHRGANWNYWINGAVVPTSSSLALLGIYGLNVTRRHR